MSKKSRVIFSVTQILWHSLFFLCLTRWSKITTIPRFEKPAVILERDRWFWLTDAPNSGIGHTESGVLYNSMDLLFWIEAVLCVIYICLYLKKHWFHASRRTRIFYGAVLCAGILVIVLFQMQMHQNFLNMTEYYYLWQSVFPAEILAIMIIIFAMIGRMSWKNKKWQRSKSN